MFRFILKMDRSSEEFRQAFMIGINHPNRSNWSFCGKFIFGAN